MVDDLSELLGKRLLFSVRYVDENDELLSRYQACGVVTDIVDVVTIDVPGTDEPFTLPPEPEAYEPANAGEYRLHETGETIVDPDYTTIWTVQPPSEDN